MKYYEVKLIHCYEGRYGEIEKSSTFLVKAETHNQAINRAVKATTDSVQKIKVKENTFDKILE